MSEIAKRIIISSIEVDGPMSSFGDVFDVLVSRRRRIENGGAQVTSENANRWIEELIAEGRLQRVPMFRRTRHDDDPIVTISLP
jgi:hypothetical protein